ncbi:MAG: toll/interleukin-1 receptor domain-containing protein [Candidatus Aminicenantes bacterium]|nr:toll/interleukin-1 receptor domain-containing protein [Candidatus Aminicenantes bacterium]
MKVFIGFNPKERPSVSTLCRSLRSEGITCMPIHPLVPRAGIGRLSAKKIELAITRSDAVVLVLSPDFFRKEWEKILKARLKDLDPEDLRNKLLIIESRESSVRVPRELEGLPTVKVKDLDKLDQKRQAILKEIAMIVQKAEVADEKKKRSGFSRVERRAAQRQGIRKVKAVRRFGTEFYRERDKLKGRQKALMSEPPERRALQCRVYRQEPGESLVMARSGLQPNESYNLAVRIGLPSPGFTDADTPFPVETLEQKYPKEVLDQGLPGWRLRVVFYETFNEKAPAQAAQIQLPESGDSTSAVFSFSAPADRERFQARLVILYKNRILQTGLYAVPVGREGGPTLKIESLLDRHLKDLDRKPGFDAALVFNHGDDGKPGVLGISEAQSVRLPLETLQEAADKICEILTEFTTQPDIRRWNDVRIKDMLYALAHQGNSMADAVGAILPECLRRAARIQVLETRSESFVPIEFFYGRQAPDRDAPLCPRALKGLLRGACRCDLKEGPQERTVICPLGFWGLNRVIERHRAETPVGPDAQGCFLNTDSGESRESLKPFFKTLFAASDKVDTEKPGTSRAVFEELQKLSQESFQAKDWNEWQALILEHKPALLVLIAHTQEDPQAKIPVLEIGRDQFLPSSGIEESYLRPPGTAAEPLVLLIGCSTARSEISFQSFIPRLKRKGASVVLATVAAILGRQAGPMTREFLVQLKKASRRPGAKFGDVLLRVRRRVLAKGRPLALALAAFGDADYLIG